MPSWTFTDIEFNAFCDMFNVQFAEASTTKTNHQGRMEHLFGRYTQIAKYRVCKFSFIVDLNYGLTIYRKIQCNF